MQQDASVTMLNTSLIVPNKYQPRKVFDETALNTLAESIKNYGIINPILVRKKEDKYEIIAGERRFRAAKKIGLSEIPVIVKNADEQQMAELALIENLERQSLTPIEEAKSYEEIMRIGNQTQASLANKLGKSQAAIANKIRLLSLPQEIQDALVNKKISERHARTLISVKEKEKQIELLNRIMKEKLTVKETEQIINTKEIDEEEIKKAINDIMKSLNIQDDIEEKKKEEKEDDNMNNGNFFPNFDNNNMSNNNASLNMMNMQSMNQGPMAPQPEVVMPTVNQPMEAQQPILTPQPMMSEQQNPMMTSFDQFSPMNQTPIEQPVLEPMNNQIPENNGFLQQAQPAPMINEIPLFGPQPLVQEPAVNQEQPIPTNPVDMQPQMSTPMVDEPLFNPVAPMPTPDNMVNPTPEIEQPTNPVSFDVPVSTNPVDMQPQMSAPMVDEPLFNPAASMTTPDNMVNPTPEMEQPTNPVSFDVPVSTNPVETTMPINKLQQLLDMLNSNGYEYKSYSNENTDCIIIEIPRN